MLLYIDKKKQRQRKIKILSLCVCSIFILLININSFNISLHNSELYLTDYTSIKTKITTNKNSPITIFTNHKSTPKIILIPQNITRPNSINIAQIFSSLPQQIKQIHFTSDIKDSIFLTQILQLISPHITISQSNSSALIITSNEHYATTYAQQANYIPLTTFYSSKTFKTPTKLTNLLNLKFPPQKIPQNKLEQEQQNLESFVADYNFELKKLLTSLFNKKDTDLKFSNQNIFLQNANLCLSNSNETACSFNTQKSLLKNLSIAANKFISPPRPNKLHLLTSLQEIKSPNELTTNDGIMFKYEAREAILLPPILTTHPFYELKQKAGINPEYQTNKMKFYKFKTVEIDIHDKI